MDDLMRTRLDAQHGAITAAEAAGCGCARETLARLVGRGDLLRVHPGCFVDAVRYAAARPEERRALSARAVARGFGGRHAASHVSAAALHGLPLVGVDDDRVHLSRTAPGRPRRTHEVVIHPAVPRAQLCRVGGVLAVLPAVAIVRTAATAGLVAGVVAADAALARGTVDLPRLRRAAAVVGRCHGIGDVRRMLELADGRPESPGESWARVLFRGLGLPPAVPQAEIRDEDGWFVARVDFLFRAQRTVAEFDGMLKYGGEAGQRALVEEKRREDRLRSLGFAVVRLTWADLSTPAVVERKVRAGFALAAR